MLKVVFWVLGALAMAPIAAMLVIMWLELVRDVCREIRNMDL